MRGRECAQNAPQGTAGTPNGTAAAGLNVRRGEQDICHEQLSSLDRDDRDRG